jgi:putative protease
VLAPAGDLDCVRAAVENGADAVYFGVTKFNARARARNFAVEELPDLLSMLRLRGVRGYVTFNTLVFSNELDEAEKLLERIVAAGPDALLLQDLGVARLVREMAPGLPLHASTQTTTTCAEQMDLLRELGFERVVLARELSIAEIRKIRAESDMPLEVFAHGALCVAYSGQCLTSEALGGRSANRGACAQACRLPYDLIVDGSPRDLGERKYLISPQDLDAHALVPELLDLVVSLKIEGRLKTPEYVAATVRTYRKAVDLAAEATYSREEELALQQVFSRGFSPGFLSGVDHQRLVRGLSPKKRGVFLGTVSAVSGDRVAIALQAPLKPGDGVVFDYGKPEDDEPGGRVTHVWRDGRRVEAADAPDAAEFAVHDCPLPEPGWRVWKTSDPALSRELRATFEKTGPRVPVDAVAEEAGGNLRVTLSDGARQVVAEAGPLQEARNRPLTAEVLREQLGRLGTTPFELRGLETRLGNVMLPVSRLNELRRRLAEDLVAARRANPGHELRPGALSRLRATPSRTEPPLELVVLARSLVQLEAALGEGAREVECDFEDIRRYRDAVELARGKSAAIFLAPPRIHKPGEAGILKNLLGAGADGVLVRSTAHLDFFKGVRRIGDYSLNAANELSVGLLLARGLERLVPSYDLNWEQLQALIARVDPGRLEVTAHQHMPMFHMEHCVFAAELSKGKDATDCGRPCDRHALRMRDWSGREHPLRADVGCRNTIYNAVPQSASAYVRKMSDLGVRRFRVELLQEKSDEVRRLVRGYRDVLEGRADGQALWRELRASSVLGVTRGPLGRDE